jgi:hypothetical protein
MFVLFLFSDVFLLLVAQEGCQQGHLVKHNLSVASKLAQSKRGGDKANDGTVAEHRSPGGGVLQTLGKSRNTSNERLKCFSSTCTTERCTCLTPKLSKRRVSNKEQTTQQHYLTWSVQRGSRSFHNN